MPANGLDLADSLEQLDPAAFDRFAQRFHALRQQRWDSHLPSPNAVPWPLRLAFAALVAIVFFTCAWQSKTYLFDSDDLMNLHEAYTIPTPLLLRDLALPFTNFNRPTGAAYYRLCFKLFGWNPGAFRTASWALMLATLFILYLLARRLTGSMEMAALAALLYSFHARLRWLYDSNGTVYDILCSGLMLLTLWYYIRVRQDGRKWTLWRLGVLLAIFFAALNAKETAALLPALLLVYEGISYPRQSLRRHAWIGLAFGVLAAFSLWAKTRPGGPFHGEMMYTPVYTLQQFFRNMRTFHSELFYLHGRTLGPKQVVLLWLALPIVPAFAKPRLRNALWFAAAFALLTPLPVVFLPLRGFYVMYVPLAGWSIWFAILLVEARDWLIREVRRDSPIPRWGWTTARLALATLVALIVAQGTRDIDFRTPHLDPIPAIIENTRRDFLAMNEPLPAHAHAILMHARFPDDAWGPLMIERLLYRDRTLWLDRPTQMKTPPDAAALAAYDRVLDFDGHRMFVVSRRPAPAAAHEPPLRPRSP
jgi:hypothetical protein